MVSRNRATIARKTLWFTLDFSFLPSMSTHYHRILHASFIHENHLSAFHILIETKNSNAKFRLFIYLFIHSSIHLFIHISKLFIFSIYLFIHYLIIYLSIYSFIFYHLFHHVVMDTLCLFSLEHKTRM